LPVTKKVKPLRKSPRILRASPVKLFFTAEAHRFTQRFAEGKIFGGVSEYMLKIKSFGISEK
jgi:hypothetical protein